MSPLVLLFSAIVPGLFLVWYFHSRDASPIAARRLWATFIYGCLCTIPAVLVGLVIQQIIPVRGGLQAVAVTAFLQAGLAEEAAKLIVLLGYSLRSHQITDPMDGLVYGATASLGFATLENVLYVADGGVGTAIMRAILSVPAHAFFGAVMGYYVGRARTLENGKGNPNRLILQGLLTAAFLHGLYDFGLFGAGTVVETSVGRRNLSDEQTLLALGMITLTIVAFVSAWRMTLRFVRQLRSEQQVLLPMRDDLNAAVLIGSPSLSGTPLPPPGMPRHALVQWVWLLLGGILASIGGIFLLIAACTPFLAEAGQNPIDVSLGALIVGIPFSLLGLWLFRLGLPPRGLP